METFRHDRLTIELHNDEVTTMREIARLAHERLLAAPLVQLHGVPLQRQAGLVGPDLFRVKEMLEKLGKSLGIELPMDAVPDEVTVIVNTVGFDAMPEGLRDALHEAIRKTVAAMGKGAKA